MMRSGVVCLLRCFSCALTSSAQSTLSPKDAAAYWHQKKDWNNVQAYPVISGAAEGQSIADYWHSTHANPNFICATCSSPTSPTGSVFSGSYPIIGAQVYLFAAATGGYGTPNNPVASISLLTNGVQDANGNYYVVTDVNGNFYINGNVTCTPNQQVYAYAVGGSIDPSLSLTGYTGTNSTGGGALSYPYAIAVDGSGDVWITNADSASVTEFAGAATPVVTPFASGVETGMLGMRP